MSSAIEIFVPGSKSLTQRALIQAALARGRSVIINPCLCDDAFLLRDALLRMDVDIRQKPGKWEIISSGRLKTPRSEIDVDLLKFGDKWLRFALFAEKTMPIKEDVMAREKHMMDIKGQ